MSEDDNKGKSMASSPAGSPSASLRKRSMSDNKSPEATDVQIFGEPNPECCKCKGNESEYWNKLDDGTVICNACRVAQVLQESGGGDDGKGGGIDGASRAPLRKSTRSTRSTRSKQNPYAYPRPVTKGKGRRSIFKKVTYTAPPPMVTPILTSCVFYKGSYFRVGDIVSLLDVDGGIFYAQVRGLLQDQYCEKSAVLTWLLPTSDSPPPEHGFDPGSYILGMEEDEPRNLDCMEFVMHAPSDYYRVVSSPYRIDPRLPPEPDVVLF